MGHLAKVDGTRCDVTDEIEAAITLKKQIKVILEDGSSRAGLPKDLVAKNGEDYLQIENHLPIAVSEITRVEVQKL